MLPTLTIGPLTLSSPVLLAPMAGYTDLPFRLTLRELGGLGLAYTEMLNPQSILLGGGRKRKAILATDPSDQPLAHQLYGKDPGAMAAAAQWLADRGAILIDINMGCPQRKIATGGAGAGLLREPAAAVALARRVVESVRLPVTAKLRLGWDDDRRVAPDLARDLEQAGIAAITVHGRTRGQRYAGTADWDGIRETVQSVESIPVIGNGDVDSPAAAREMLDRTGCAGIMLGRAPLKHPWIIREIHAALQGQAASPPTPEERRRFLLTHFDRHESMYGAGAAVLFRKWLAQYARGFQLSREEWLPLLQIRGNVQLRSALTALG